MGICTHIHKYTLGYCQQTGLPLRVQHTYLCTTSHRNSYIRTYIHKQTHSNICPSSLMTSTATVSSMSDRILSRRSLNFAVNMERWYTREGLYSSCRDCTHTSRIWATWKGGRENLYWKLKKDQTSFNHVTMNVLQHRWIDAWQCLQTLSWSIHPMYFKNWSERNSTLQAREYAACIKYTLQEGVMSC